MDHAGEDMQVVDVDVTSDDTQTVASNERNQLAKKSTDVAATSSPSLHQSHVAWSTSTPMPIKRGSMTLPPLRSHHDQILNSSPPGPSTNGHDVNEQDAEDDESKDQLTILSTPPTASARKKTLVRASTSTITSNAAKTAIFPVLEPTANQTGQSSPPPSTTNDSRTNINKNNASNRPSTSIISSWRSLTQSQATGSSSLVYSSPSYHIQQRAQDAVSPTWTNITTSIITNSNLLNPGARVMDAADVLKDILATPIYWASLRFKEPELERAYK
ncbi:hypothetical protein HDU76_009978, partial [Blyttiomyces sp. JEL0837]